MLSTVAVSTMLCAVLASVALALCHVLYVTKRVPLSRPEAYTAGVAILLAGFWLWAWLESDIRAAAAITTIALAGGGTIRVLWAVNGARMPQESWPGVRLSAGQLRVRMIELIENMQAERAVARDFRREADELHERIDFYLRFLRDPANWKPETSFRDVRSAVGQEPTAQTK